VETNQDPSVVRTRPILAVVSEDPEQSTWLDYGECERAGVTLAWVGGAGRSPSVDLAAVKREIDGIGPDACLLLSDGALSRYVWVLADLAGLPVFAVVTTDEQLVNLTRRRKPRPDLFFIANPELLKAALEDERYGSTLLAIGHPARDLMPSGPSAQEARERLLGAVRRWWRGEIAPATPDLSIIVPAYREADNLPMVCGRLVDTIERSRLNAEVLIVDDGSPDETYGVALAQMWRSPCIRPFTKTPPRGMGNTIRHGLARARGPIVAITMGDGSDEVSRIPEMFRKVRDEHYGLAIGSRYRLRENYESVPRLYRFWSAIFRYTTWALVGLRLRDYTNAFRVFRREVFERQGLEGGGFEISPEITFKAWFASRRVAEVDVKHLKRGSGQSNFSFLRAGPGYGKMLLKALICRVTGRWFVLDW
jgi:hypothetical protein